MIQWIGLGAKMTLADPVEQAQSNSTAASKLPHKWAGRREALLGEAVRRPLTAVKFRQDHSFFPLGHLYQEMQVGSPKVWGFFRRFKNQYPEPNLLSEHRNSYQGGFRNKTITANCIKVMTSLSNAPEHRCRSLYITKTIPLSGSK